ncbi:MAG: O-antigen ligase family protein [Chloroflexi bacterium]|nr:O-antigen ligase family protein [Chloroflexota bacterium]
MAFLIRRLHAPISFRSPIAEPFLVVLAVPLLLFPRGFLPWVGLGLLTLGWLLRGLATDRWLIRTPLDLPILILFLMTLASLYPSVDLSLSMPKFYGILLGFAVYYAACGAVTSRRRFWFGVGLLVAGLVAVLLVGLVGTSWMTTKFPLLKPAYTIVPRLIQGAESSVGPITGFNPNELGGALAFLLPLPLALLLRARLSPLWRLATGAALLLGLCALALSASRTALAATAMAVAVLFVWRWRRPGIAFSAALVAVCVLAYALSGASLLDYAPATGGVDNASGTLGFAARMEIWDRARYMIEDFPFTGIGLNTFPLVIETLYPTFLVDPDVRIPHAHNIFLQTAVDLGLGGLLGFVALWASVAYAGWKAYRKAGSSPADNAMRAAILGLLLGLLAYLIFGLTDAITLGAKPTVLLWLMMGLIVSAERLMGQPSVHGHKPSAAVHQRPTPPSRRAADLVLPIVRDTYWAVAFFLVAMGFLVVGLGISGWVP